MTTASNTALTLRVEDAGELLALATTAEELDKARNQIIASQVLGRPTVLPIPSFGPKLLLGGEPPLDVPPEGPEVPEHGGGQPHQRHRARRGADAAGDHPHPRGPCPRRRARRSCFR